MEEVINNILFDPISKLLEDLLSNRLPITDNPKIPMARIP